MAQCSRKGCHLPEQGEDHVVFDFAGSVFSVSIEGFNRGNKITVLQMNRKFTGDSSHSPGASPIITFLLTIYSESEYNGILPVIARRVSHGESFHVRRTRLGLRQRRGR